MRNISKYVIILFIIILALPVFGQKKKSLTISGVIAAKFINMRRSSLMTGTDIRVMFSLCRDPGM